MTFILSLLLFLHIVGAALVLGLWVANFRPPKVLPLQFWAALLSVVTGLLMVGLLEMDGAALNHVKVGVKLVIGLVVAVAAFLGQRRYRRDGAVPTGLAHAVGGLALINIAVATLWS